MALLRRLRRTGGGQAPGRQRSWLRGFPYLLLRLSTAGGGHAVGTLSVWLWWERFNRWHWDIRPISPGGLLYYSLDRHRGKLIVLNDGTVIRHGDTIIDIHMNNHLLMQFAAVDRLSPFRGLRDAGKEVDILAREIAAGRLGDVRAIHGITLYATVFSRVGLEQRELPRTPWWRLVRYYMVGLLITYHPDGWKRISNMEEAELWPGELWLGIETLRRRIAQGEEATARHHPRA